MIKLLLLISIVLLILISIFLVSKVTIYVEYYHCLKKDKAVIKARLWKGLLSFTKEIPVPPDEKYPYSFNESTYRQSNHETNHTSSNSESVSMDNVQAAFHNMKEMLTQMRSYQSATKKITSKIEITDLRIEIHYGSGEASSTALATGALWSVAGGVVGIFSRYFQLKVQPKIEIIPYFAVKKPFETKIDCIVRFRLAKTMLAGLKLARLLKKTTK